MWSKSALFAVLLQAVAMCAQAAAVGEKFPPMVMNDVGTGVQVDLSRELDGKVGAVVVMQTSCGVCRKELAALKDIETRNPSLRVVAVAIDSGNPGRIENYRKNNGFPFRFVHDPEFVTGEHFGFKFTPGMVLTSRDGTIVLIKGGYKAEDKDELEKTIDGLAR